MSSTRRDLVIILLVALIIFSVCYSLDVYELAHHIYENNKFLAGIDEFIIAIAALTPAFIIFSYRRWREYSLEIALRKKSGDELQSKVRFLQVLIDTIPNPVFYKDIQGRYLGCNMAFEHFVGRKRQEIIGKTVYDMGPREIADTYFDKDRELFENPGTQHYEWKIKDRQDRVHDVFFDKATFSDSKGTVAGLIGVITDITERKRLEEEILRSQKLESLGILAGGIAHDFNNLLTAILGNISLASLQLQPETPPAQRLADAEKASLKARGLARQLLTFSKGGTPVKKTLSMKQLVMDTSSFSLRGSNVACQYFIPDDLWLVDADPSQISQVVNNLIINAIQAMPQGGNVKIIGENVIIDESDRFLTEGKYVKMSICDEGCGISEADRTRIFDPYFTTKKTGSGLGLATVYSIVRKHDGHIRFESEAGKGSTFSVLLPASEQVNTQSEDSGNSSQAACRTSSNRSILLMDDDEDIRLVGAEMLTYFGYRVKPVKDGAEAFEAYRDALAKDSPFDAVILDLTIPGGMGGREVIKELLKIDPCVRAIASSGYANDPLSSDYRLHGFKGFVPKPYQAAELASIVGQVVSGQPL